MARTSRTGVPANNLDALDNLDLDDMFTEGGDALFDVDGFDVDLVNMDDIANNNESTPTSAAANGAAAASPAAASPAAADEATPKRRKTKRKTTAPTFFDDLDDESADQEPTKKKRRTSKMPKRGGRGKKAAPAADTTPAPSKTKKGKKSVTPNPNTGPVKAAVATPAASGVISTPPAGVAAAGQFGGRQKKVGGTKAGGTKVGSTKVGGTKIGTTKPGRTKATSKKAVETKIRPPLPLVGNRAGAPLPPPPSVATLPLSPPKAPPPKPVPPQSLFCGLSPSNTLFYPFLPALPQEVSFKSRKVFTLLEKVSSTLTGAMHNSSGGNTSSSSVNPSTEHKDVVPAKEDEPIFKLTQDAFKEEKNATMHATAAQRSKSIGTAIGVVRKTIAESDKSKLAHDLLAVCALLRRQHDFVKQNNANMERWCKEHYSEDDYLSVYHEGKKKRKVPETHTAAPDSAPSVSVLASFKVLNVKIKLNCTGFKEPKSQQLLATLPSDPKRILALKTKKKEADGIPSAPNRAPSSAAAMAAAAAAAAMSADLPYIRQTPAKRRKAVGLLISRVAQAVETRHNQRIESKRQGVFVQEKRRRDVAEDSSVAVSHTGGMWKYLQETRYFEEPVTDAELQDRVDWIQAMNVVPPRIEVKPMEDRAPKKEHKPEGSLTDRLFGLLVEEEGESDLDDMDETKDDDISSESDNSMLGEGENLLDMSELTDDQRALIQLRIAGLLQDESVDGVPAMNSNGNDLTKASVASSEKQTGPVMRNGSSHQSQSMPLAAAPQPTSSTTSPPEQDSLDSVIEAMTADLQRINTLTNARACFVQKIARSRLETPEASTRRKQREATTLAKGAALLKRNKEAKAKAGKAKSKQDDDLKLPW